MRKGGAPNYQNNSMVLQNVRVVQRNLVYVVGLPMELCYEELLSSTDYIGQYGKIVKVQEPPGPYLPGT